MARGEGERQERTANAGTLIRTAKGEYLAQFSIGAGQRKGALLTACKGEEAAKRRKAAIAQLVANLREAGHIAVIANTIRDGARLDAEGFRKLQKLVGRIVAGKEPGLAGGPRARREGMTVSELAKLWTSGELAEQYPDHVRVKKTSGDDARIFTWLSKVRMPDGSTFGDRVVAEMTLDDCDHVMAALPKTAESPAARRHYAQSLRKLLTYAVYPLRLLPTLPIPKGWLPRGGSDKAKGWVYPSEDLALMQCRQVPLVRRVLFGLLVREGMRVSEALGLAWSDLDLERGVVRLDTNKTDNPRSWALGEDVVRALEAWRSHRGRKAEKVPHVFPKVLVGDRGDLAHHLREGLKLAGVNRPELIEPKAGRLLLRAHDLRGSFVTLALAAGRTEAWVTNRTGHRSSQMIYLYKRASRTAAELELGWLASLDEAIPELAPKGPQGANGVQTGVPRGSERSPGRSRNTGKNATSRLPSPSKRALLIRRSRVRVPLGPPNDIDMLGDESDVTDETEPGPICTSVCTPVDETILGAAIDRLTRALATADDEDIAGLVTERRALREELALLREQGAGVVRLDDERARRGPKR